MKFSIHCWRSKLVPAAIVVVTNGLLCCCNASPNTFEAEGTITHQLFDQRGLEKQRLAKHFMVVVDRASWMIRTTSIDASPEEPIISEEVGFDGTNLFELTLSDSNKLTSARASVSKSQRPRNFIYSTGIISTNSIPRTDMRLISPIWFAFISSCSTDLRAGGKMKPLSFYPDKVFYDERFSNEAVAEYDGPLASFPKYIALLNSGSELGPMGGGKFVTYGKPYDRGFTNAIYSVTAFTNINSISVPRDFSYLCLAPTANGTKSSDLFVNQRFDGRVHAARSGNSLPSLRPRIVELTMVQDSRLYLGTNKYTYTTKRWMETNESALQAPYQNIKQLIEKRLTGRKQYRASPSRRIVVAVLFVTALIAPAALFYFRWRRN